MCLHRAYRRVAARVRRLEYSSISSWSEKTGSRSLFFRYYAESISMICSS